MKKYVIIVTFINGKTMSRTTLNQYFAQHLIKIFIKHDKVTDVRMKIVRDRKDQTKPNQGLNQQDQHNK